MRTNVQLYWFFDPFAPIRTGLHNPPMRLPPARLFPWSLLPAALVLELGALYLARAFPLVNYFAVSVDMGGLTGHSPVAFVIFVIIFTLQFTVLLGAVRSVRGCGRNVLVPVLLTGAIISVTLSFVYPITANDVYSYIAQSWLMIIHHQNPIFVSPSAFPQDQVTPLTGEWMPFGSAYGPVGLIVDAVPTLLAGQNLLADVLMDKLLYSAVLLGDAYLLYRLASRVLPDRAVTAALLVAWNPLLLFETSVNGHNDVLMMMFVLLGLLSLVEGDEVIGTALVAASGLVKFGTLVLLPLVMVAILARRPGWGSRAQYIVRAGVVCLIVWIVAYYPFWRGFDTLHRPLLENQLFLDSFASVAASLFGPVLSPGLALILGRLLFGAAYACALLLSARSDRGLFRASFIATFALLAFGVSNFKIWYAVWPLVLAPLTPDLLVPSILLGWGATISAGVYGYIWVWLGLQFATSFIIVNTSAYLLAFVPAGAALTARAGLFSFVSRISRKHRSPSPEPLP